MKEYKKRKWEWVYYNEVTVGFGIVLGIFGIMFVLIHYGASVQNAAEVGGSLIIGFILLPLVEPIRYMIKRYMLKKK